MLTVGKTKVFIVDFHNQAPPLHPLTISGTEVEWVDSKKFLNLDLHKSFDLSWSVKTAVRLRKAQKRLHFIRLPKKA